MPSSWPSEQRVIACQEAILLSAVGDPLEVLAIVFELRAFVDRVDALVASGWEPGGGVAEAAGPGAEPADEPPGPLHEP